VYLTPPLKGFPLEFCIGARGCKSLNDGATRRWKRFWDRFSRLDTISAVTDSHPASHVAVASTRSAYLRHAVKTLQKKDEFLVCVWSSQWWRMTNSIGEVVAGPWSCYSEGTVTQCWPSCRWHNRNVGETERRRRRDSMRSTRRLSVGGSMVLFREGSCITQSLYCKRSAIRRQWRSREKVRCGRSDATHRETSGSVNNMDCSRSRSQRVCSSQASTWRNWR